MAATAADTAATVSGTGVTVGTAATGGDTAVVTAAIPPMVTIGRITVGSLVAMVSATMQIMAGISPSRRTATHFTAPGPWVSRPSVLTIRTTTTCRAIRIPIGMTPIIAIFSMHTASGVACSSMVG